MEGALIDLEDRGNAGAPNDNLIQLFDNHSALVPYQGPEKAANPKDKPTAPPQGPLDLLEMEIPSSFPMPDRFEEEKKSPPPEKLIEGSILNCLEDLMTGGGSGPSQGAFENVELGEDDCKHITVKFNELEFPVSWYSDTANEDVQMAVLCACDSIVDSGFEILNPDGQPIDIKQIHTVPGRGEKYTLIEGKELKEYEKLLGNRWRKLVLEVEPLRHVEAQRAFQLMQLGSNLLKHTQSGYPHIRQFQLNSDYSRLIWFSSKKHVEKSQVNFTDICHITCGQKTAAFDKYPLPSLAHLSFSIHYKIDGKGSERTLDLVTKDEYEYDLWVTGVRALSYHFKGYPISKMALLGHSRVFNETIKIKKVGSANKVFFEPEDAHAEMLQSYHLNSKTLEDAVNRRTLSKAQLSEKIKNIEKKLRNTRNRVEEVTEELEHNPIGEGFGEGYTMVAANEARADDKMVQVSRMMNLLERCEEAVDDLQSRFAELEKEGKLEGGDSANYKNSAIKALDCSVWKVEIDIENVHDICRRLVEDSQQTLQEKLKSFLPKIF